MQINVDVSLGVTWLTRSDPATVSYLSIR